MERRELLAAVGTGASTLAAGYTGARATNLLSTDRDPRPTIHPTLRAEGPASATATLTVTHLRIPQCQNHSPSCNAPIAVDSLLDTTTTLYPNQERSWDVPISTSSAIDRYAVDVTTDETNVSKSLVARSDYETVTDSTSIDLIVPPETKNSVTEDLVGPLTLTITVD